MQYPDRLRSSNGSADLLPESGAQFGSVASGSTGRRMLYFIAAAVLGAGAGVSLVHVPIPMVLAALLSLTFVVIVLRRPFLGLLVYTIIFMLRPAELYPVLAPLHLERVMGMLALVSIFLDQHRREGRFLIDASRQTRFLLFFILAALLSVPFAAWRSQATDTFIDLLRIACFYLMVVHCVDTRSRLRYFILTFSFFILFIAFTSLRSYLSGGSFYAQGIDRAVGVTSAGGDANTLATTIAAALPIFLLLSLDKSVGAWRLVTAPSVVLLLCTQLITGSRGSLLGLLGALAWLWSISRYKFPLLIAGLCLVAVAYGVMPDQYKQRYSTMTNAALDESSLGRLDAWKAGMRMLADRPLFGVGVGCFSTAHALTYSTGPKKNWLQPHNLYVQVLAELGLAGAIAFFGFLYQALRSNRNTVGDLLATRPRWQFERNMLNGVFAGFVVLLIAGMFGHSLLRRTWYLYAAVGLAILRIHADSPASSPGDERR